MSGGRTGHSTTEEGARNAAERLVFFSDAVVAIALTLLAIELPVPAGASASELATAVGESFSEYLAFLISFLVIFLHWNGHHRLLRYLTDGPPALVRWNGLWLFAIVLTPFVTKVLTGGDGGGSAFPWRFGLYALVQVVAGVGFLMTALTMRREGLIEPGAPPELVTHSLTRILALVVVFGVSIPIAFVIGQWAYVVWSIGQPLFFAVLRLRRRRTTPPPPVTEPDPEPDPDPTRTPTTSQD